MIHIHCPDRGREWIEDALRPRRIIAEARAYEVLRDIVLDLIDVERTLRMVQETVPDEHRADNLAAIRAAREALQRFV
jgi:hypothetical protein